MAQYRRSGLNGPRGLIMGIISQAAEDLSGEHGKELQITAHLYFQSDLYREHLDWLGLKHDVYALAMEDPPGPAEVIRTLTRRGKKSYLHRYFSACERGRKLIETIQETKGKSRRRQTAPQLAFFGVS